MILDALKVRRNDPTRPEYRGGTAAGEPGAAGSRRPSIGWRRAWLRSFLMALVPALFGMPFVTAEFCTCAPRASCNNSGENVTLAVRAESTGYQLVLGKTTIEAESRLPRYGTTAEVTQRAEEFFDDRTSPTPLAAAIPLVAIIGAALVVASSRRYEWLRGGIALTGLIITAMLQERQELHLTGTMQAFALEMGVSDANVETKADGAAWISLVFTIALLGTILTAVGHWLRRTRHDPVTHDARELDVQYLLGHSTPDMVRRYSSSYRSEQAAMRHHAFSPGDQMLANVVD